MKSSPQALGNSHAIKRELAGEVLRSSGSLRLRVTGRSMLPAIWPGDTLEIERATPDAISEGDIAMFTTEHRFVAHRVVAKDCASGISKLQTQGDTVSRPDSPVAASSLIGKVSSIVRNGKRLEPRRHLSFSERAVATVFRHSEIAARVVVGIHGLRQTSRP
jgi:signal peptidase I